MFKWLTDIYHKSEKEVYAEAGQDVLFYLIYLKYSMVLYWVIGLCTGLPLFFVYGRLSMPDQSLITLKTFSEKYSIQALIERDEKQNWKISIVLIIYVFNVTVAHMHQYFLETKIKEIKLHYDKKQTNYPKRKLIKKIKESFT